MSGAVLARPEPGGARRISKAANLLIQNVIETTNLNVILTINFSHVFES